MKVLENWRVTESFKKCFKKFLVANVMKRVSQNVHLGVFDKYLHRICVSFQGSEGLATDVEEALTAEEAANKKAQMKSRARGALSDKPVDMQVSFSSIHDQYQNHF